MIAGSHYAIKGGIAGRERLRILSRTLHASTASLFEQLGVGKGMHCLDIGCGGGDVTVELARRVGPSGSVVGVDMDEAKLMLARQEVAAMGINTVTFQTLDICTQELPVNVDLVYMRFLLTHLADPAHALAASYHSLRPGGLLIVEDIDAGGAFTWPECAAFLRYRALYDAVVLKRGGDPIIGQRLPVLLTDSGFAQVGMHVVQPIGVAGDAKLINPITMEMIGDAVLRDGLASREEIDGLVKELYAFAANPRTVAGVARVVQVWGRRPDSL